MPSRITFEMVKLKLLKSVFRQNPTFSEEREGGGAARLQLTLRNLGDFSKGDTVAHFVQCFKTKVTKGIPFVLEADHGAIFAMSEPVPDGEKDHFLQTVFPRLIFPHTREYVAETTRRGGFPPLLINMFPAAGPESGADFDLATDRGPVSKWIH
ncbi:MAG: protein-export chaperone SecB [Deltaproteobacteria bacterium]|jgi:preprotein translocase subunit SecB|nr:protein-export chaperone SecB [Deltaproteobacteria bacterium]